MEDRSDPSPSDNPNKEPVARRRPFICMPRGTFLDLLSEEVRTRPRPDYLTIQRNIDVSSRAEVIGGLAMTKSNEGVKPKTNVLHLAVNYMDRYLSRNMIQRDEFAVLGLACITIASKHVLNKPNVCFGIYSKEIYDKENAVTESLSSQLEVPTIRSFLRSFLVAAKLTSHELSMKKMACLAEYLAELSLLEYKMLACTPSLIAASAVFLAKVYLREKINPPWNITLWFYTGYQPSQLRFCVWELHTLFHNSRQNMEADAIRMRYHEKCLEKQIEEEDGRFIMPEVDFEDVNPIYWTENMP